MTLECIATELNRDNVLGVREDPRIAEQQFGNFQDVEAVKQAKRERWKFGQFFYRFPSGEAGMDVYSRATSFLATVLRDTASVGNLEGDVLKDLNIVIVTHGLTLRLLLMRWFHLRVVQFEASRNPGNATLVVMERKAAVEREGGKLGEWFELDEASQVNLNLRDRRYVAVGKPPSPLGDGTEEAGQKRPGPRIAHFTPLDETLRGNGGFD